jgi:hypothetical protein
VSNHSILHPGILHYAYAVLRHGVYGHAALCIRMAAVFHTVGSHHQGSHPLDVSRVMIPLTQIHGSPDPGSMHLHIPHTASRDTALRVCCTTPWACTCMLLRGIPGLLWSIHHRRISPPGISSSGCLPGHDPTHQDPRISGSRISTLHISTSCGAGALHVCTSTHGHSVRVRRTPRTVHLG